MIRNYFIIAWRNLFRNKFISLINIGGLAIGISTFMIIAIYVSYELSYDKGFEKKDRIYLYSEYVSYVGEDFRLSNTVPPNRKQYLSQIANVEKVARLFHYAAGSGNSSFVSAYNEDQTDKRTFEESGIYITEQEFLDMFKINFLYGNRSSALQDMRTVVLSKSMAMKYFGKCSGDLVGETLFVHDSNQDENSSFTITGIFEDLPPNTHINIDIMISYITKSFRNPGSYEDSADDQRFQTYVLLQESNDIKKIEGEMLNPLHTMMSEYYQITVEKYQGNQEDYIRVKPALQSLSSIYFLSPSGREFWNHGNKSHVVFLITIALITLLIAWINYVNLSLVQIMARAKEAGIRKVIGANRGAIGLQFIIEALIANLIALHLSVTIISLVLPYLPEFIGKSLTFSIWFEGFPNTGLFWLMCGGIFFISFLVTSLYPSLVFSKTNPVNSLKNQSFEIKKRISGGKNLRAAFVFTQFASVYVLLGVTLGVYLQLNFFQQKDLGFNKEQVLVLRSPLKSNANSSTIDLFKEKIKSENISERVSLSSSVPGNTISIAQRILNIPDNQYTSKNRLISADSEFLQLFDFKILAGRNFNEAYEGDKNAILINKKTLHNLGYENPKDIIGHEIQLNNVDHSDPFGKRRVIGVIDNYHHLSPKDDYLAISFIQEGGALTRIKNGQRVITWSFKKHDRSFVSLKVRTDEIQKTVASVKKLWNEAFPGFEFNYFFADQNYGHQYRSEMKFGSIFLVFTIISISLACLGFLGMTMFLINRRTKEIGIRKILGASLTNLFGLMISRFMILILFAGIAGIPFTWFILRNLLNEFAYRIDLSWWIFAIPLVFILIIALITIGGNTLRKVNTNPVEALRYE
jgi:putative ABC transport system permease protein